MTVISTYFDRPFDDKDEDGRRVMFFYFVQETRRDQAHICFPPYMSLRDLLEIGFPLPSLLPCTTW